VVTGWIVQRLAAVLHFIMGLLPVITVPSWLGTSGPMGTIFQDAALMGVWFPMGLLVTVLGAVLAAWLVGFGIKLTRIVASFFTVGGGSAG
jgi:hypothetical protein